MDKIKSILESLEQKAFLDKVQVDPRNQKWELYFKAPHYISLKEFDGLKAAILEELPDLNVSVDLAVESFRDTDIELLLEDINYLLVQKLPRLRGELREAGLTFDGENIIFETANEIVFDTIKRKKVVETITKFLAKVAPDYKFIAKFKEEAKEVLDWQLEMEEELVQKLWEEKVAERDGQENKEEVPVKLSIGKEIKETPCKIANLTEEEKNVVVSGVIFDLEVKKLKTERILITFNLTDQTDAISAKLFLKKGEEEKASLIKEGMYVKVRGEVQFDRFADELVLFINDLEEIEKPAGRMDMAETKRIELHLHSKMSAMDSVVDLEKLFQTLKSWGHEAVAITDHGVVQAFPEAAELSAKYGIKVIYGLEGYLVDDGLPVVFNPEPLSLKETPIVAFDFETSGLSSQRDEIIEIGAVKIFDGEIKETFSVLVRPQKPISAKISELTGITNDLLEKEGLDFGEAIEKFLRFCDGSILLAHNAAFDYGFLRQALKRLGHDRKFSVVDNLALVRILFPELKNHKLKTITEHLDVSLNNHHRALADSYALAEVFLKLLPRLFERGLYSLEDLAKINYNYINDRSKTYHVSILVKNQEGLYNLYRLITLSHLKYFHRHPRIPKSELMRYREGLLIGTACEAGELFTALLENQPESRILEIARFYDYFEIMPKGNNAFLLRNQRLKSEQELEELNRKIIALGEKLNKPVVATGDVHFLEPEDEIYRRILQKGQGYDDAELQPPIYLKTTEEMLKEFAYLGQEKAYEVVVDNPRKIAEQIEEIKPIPDEFYPPIIEGADRQIYEMTYQRAHELYGDPLPEIVEKRLKRELDAIINNGFAVLYLIAHKLVKKSLDDGYLVGSRGSVGSSLVATMTMITEVNPLPPHYLCPNCRYSEFITDGSYGCGADMPDKNCPRCGTLLKKEGHDIPFETFMGFEGDKVPDIDLNFSGEYQPRAHKYTEELFGKDYVFRAGTIATVADKTAFGFVKKYFEETGRPARQAWINWLTNGIVGVKRTTGQHPGGLMVVPKNNDVHRFTPLQYPADDKSAGVVTTHFDYHSISSRLVKLDILGHDDPTVLKMLEDLTGIDPRTIRLDDRKTLGIFSSTEPLGVTPEQIRTTVGTYGIPEFGTRFVRQMLEDTRPKSFTELVRISGFSHGTDVWLNNAQDLIRAGICKLSDAISTRDDIMIYLLQKGVPPKKAFKIMENVRKGKGISEEEIAVMKEHGVPDWFIGSCQKIKYLFPKAHAVAYVMMAFRIAYFKVYYPEAFYATYFTVRADDFDLPVILAGPEKIWKTLDELEQRGGSLTAKEKGLVTVLEVALEMLARGIKMLPVDLEKSDATRFLITPEGILPPFVALPGIGEAAAINIVKAREEGMFVSIEDLKTRGKATKAVIEVLDAHGCLKGLAPTSQLVLFA
ncbi:PolC-type DNA polymerase III [Carboxydothermus ferrireducens]|uniref:DNA polymerase III PolC-type n=1 Tax=Carboxydothermus ferrireducens DSM 11255 TaxID=1119529 RepID=A0ABX2RBG3_9THEO|nr:PolC-type DNA polymerase III [Carboxydothermus ferrireducens]NYE58521.1 DNA polymerase-3 subunit alpha (Gram-positive type) [Carboxydothermus ferrireducens DSM 11255]